MAAPELVVLDVDETLSGLEPLRHALRALRQADARPRGCCSPASAQELAPWLPQRMTASLPVQQATG